MSERTVFRNANLLDGESPGRAGQSVVVDGERITAVGDDAAVAAEPGDQVIELAGRTLMPGMVSCHFHTGFGVTPTAGMAPVLGLEASPTYYGILGVKNLETALQCGFTSIIGSSNPYNLDVTLKEAMTLGVFEGPRMLACTREFMTSGDMADGTNRSWFMGLSEHGLIRRLDGAEAYRQAAREELGRGCDVVKLSVGRGHGSSPTSEGCYLTSDELEATTEVARVHGKKVRAHCPSRLGVLLCARAGVDIIDHADMIDAEGIDAVLAADASICPSMLWSVRYIAFADSWDHDAAPFPIGEGFPETKAQILARLDGVRRDFEYTCKVMPEAVRAGVRMLLGDDFGFPMMPHGDYVSEMEVYVKQLGIPALDVLTWATRNGAVAMGMGDDLGTIAAGKLADLLVIDGDPSTDVTILRDPTRMPLILKNGTPTKNTLPNA